MSASLFWQPVKGRSLAVSGPSSFMEAMREVFGQDPWRLTGADRAILIGLRAAMKHEREALDKLIEAVESHDEIRVWAEF